MQLVGGKGESTEKICPLGWQLLLMDAGAVIPGAQPQPSNVAPNCVRERCAIWNEDSSACSLAVIGLEAQRRTDLLEQQYAEQQKLQAELTKGAADARALSAEHLELSKQHLDTIKRAAGEDDDAPTNRIRRELDGDADGGPSRN